MKKLFLVFLFGFIIAQCADYTSSQLISYMQDKCYPLYEKDENKYIECMNNLSHIQLLSDLVGFDFVYTTRKLIWGY